MKFALVNGQRQEAQPNVSGECPVCRRTMIAKCGEVRLRHWAHKGRLLCDPWWENETEWHRAWKNQFPDEWQEIVHPAPDGRRHIADVKTADGWVIEFQHSYIRPEERRSREAFYPKLIWVVNVTRLKKGVAQLTRAWKDGVAVVGNCLLRRAFSDDCGLLRDWAGSNAPIFFDVGDETLWWLFAKTNGWVYLAKFPRSKFIELHRNTAAEIAQFDRLNGNLKLIAECNSHPSAQPLRWDPLRLRRPRRPFRL